jgi:hypothetical protein
VALQRFRFGTRSATRRIAISLLFKTTLTKNSPRDLAQSLCNCSGALEGALFCCLYGSRIPGRDVDLMIVQRYASHSPHCALGRFDILQLSNTQFAQHLACLDPVATEPLLTGDLLWGNAKDWWALKKTVQSQKSTHESLARLKTRSFEEFAIAETLYKQSKAIQQPELKKWVVQGLSFSISYLSFYDYYLNFTDGAVTFKKLLNENRLHLEDFWRLRKSPKKLEQCAEIFLPKWRRMLSKRLPFKGNPLV